MNTTIELRSVDPHWPQVSKMFDELNQHHLAHCPPELCHLTTAEELEAQNAIVFGAFTATTLCGIGGVKMYRDYGEITRMYVASQHRGKGVADQILEQLLRVIRDSGRRLARLETSPAFADAVRLYLRKGFVFCEPFGQYVDEPYNAYMEKQL